MKRMCGWTLQLLYFFAFPFVVAQTQVDVIDGGDVTLTCKFNTPTSFCAWKFTLFGAHTAFSLEQNGLCQVTTFLIGISVPTCKENTTFGLKFSNINNTWHRQTWECSGTTADKTEFLIYVKVPVKSVNFKNLSGYQVIVNANTEKQFDCETSAARPLPNISWYIGKDKNSAQTILTNISNLPASGGANLTTAVSTLRFYPSKSYNNFIIYCKAANIPGQEVESPEVQLNILYPPDGPPLIHNGNFIKLVENRTRQLSCSIVGGNPVPTLSWNCSRGMISGTPSNSTGQASVILTASRGPIISCDCRSSYNSQRGTINVEILNPPTDITLKIEAGLISGVVKIIENTDLTLNCISTGNPHPNITWRKGNEILFIDKPLTIATIQKIDRGEYLCEAKNTMSPTDEDPFTTTKTAPVEVDVLYAPEVKPLQDQSVVDGQQLTVMCNFTPGNPSDSNFLWTRSLDDMKWTSRVLNISSVSKNDSAVYTCNIKNFMQPTGGFVQIGESKKSFKLDVLYKTSVSKFTLNGITGMATVKENGSVTIICVVDSNPESTITLLHESRLLDTENSVKILEQLLVNVTCTDGGRYWCIGSNTHNNGNPANQSNQLNVECSPRPAMQDQLLENVTSALHQSAVLQFTALAYPIPLKNGYVWFKEETSRWILIENNTETQISTFGLQSNLTILNITEKSLGRYKLEVTNPLGTWPQIFRVLAQDIPNPPTGFEHIQERVTTTSITVQWITGFNGGLQQTFVLQYRKTGSQSWSSYETIKDTTDKERHIMNHTFSNLNSGTQYDVVIYAFNSLGNSSLSEVITAWTAISPSTPVVSGAIIGPAVGGVAGIAVFGGVAYLYIRRRRIKQGSDKSRLAVKINRTQEREEDSSDEDVMVENKMYESAGQMTQDEPVYNKPTKKVKVDTKNTDVYAAVVKNKREDNQKEKKKQQKNKTQFSQGDIYENAPEKSSSGNNTYGNAAFEDNPYENPDGSKSSNTPKKNVNQEGLIYADLAFNDQPKGQKKLVIHGLDQMTTYVQVDFERKADPLPDSDTDEQSENKKK